MNMFVCSRRSELLMRETSPPPFCQIHSPRYTHTLETKKSKVQITLCFASSSMYLTNLRNNNTASPSGAMAKEKNNGFKGRDEEGGLTGPPFVASHKSTDGRGAHRPRSHSGLFYMAPFVLLEPPLIYNFGVKGELFIGTKRRRRKISIWLTSVSCHTVFISEASFKFSAFS